MLLQETRQLLLIMQQMNSAVRFDGNRRGVFLGYALSAQGA
jgi:hypothetical protein